MAGICIAFLMPVALASNEEQLTRQIFAEVDIYLDCLQSFDAERHIDSPTLLDSANDRCGPALVRLRRLAPHTATQLVDKVKRKLLDQS